MTNTTDSNSSETYLRLIHSSYKWIPVLILRSHVQPNHGISNQELHYELRIRSRPHQTSMLSTKPTELGDIYSITLL